jgi:hypothetical protein
MLGCPYPRRPARPHIWLNSLEVSMRGPLSPRLDSADITEHLAGMLTPAASVSVANTILSRPRWNRPSTRPFQLGSEVQGRATNCSPRHGMTSNSTHEVL